MRTLKKRALAMLMALTLVLGMLPTTAWAEGSDPSGENGEYVVGGTFESADENAQLPALADGLAWSECVPVREACKEAEHIHSDENGCYEYVTNCPHPEHAEECYLVKVDCTKDTAESHWYFNLKDMEYQHWGSLMVECNGKVVVKSTEPTSCTHVHDETCESTKQVQKCEVEEHTHTDECAPLYRWTVISTGTTPEVPPVETEPHEPTHTELVALGIQVVIWCDTDDDDECDNWKDHKHGTHTPESYALKEDGYQLSELWEEDGKFFCDVTIPAESYLTTFNTNTRVGHDVDDDPDSKTIRLTCKKDGSWEIAAKKRDHDNKPSNIVSFEVECNGTIITPIPTEYDITVSVTNGTADPAGENGIIKVTEGEDQTITFFPADDTYELKTVTVDGVDTELAADGSYTFENVAADHKIIVVYEEETTSDNSHTVTFYIGGVQHTIYNDVADGAMITAPAVNENPGYTFDGWYTDPGCTEEFDFETATITADITLYAKWNPVGEKLYCYTLVPGMDWNADINVNVKWNGMGIGSISGAGLAAEHTLGTLIDENECTLALPDSFPDIVIEGKAYTYTEDGSEPETYTIVWKRVVVSDGANAGANEYNKPTVPNKINTFHYDGEIRLTDKCHVSFNVQQPNGAEEKIAYLAVEKGTEKSTLSVPAPGDKVLNHKIYEFSGWFEDEAYTTSAAFDGKINTDEDYYGYYREVGPDSHTVTYDPGTQGTFGEQEHTVRCGDPTPAAPTVTGNDGYYFTGWDKAIDPTVTKDATYTAQWAEKQAVTFTGESWTDAVYNGGEQEITEISSVGLREGDTFSGLTYSAKGTNAGSYPGEFGGKVQIRDASGEDVTEQYDITKVPGALTITPAPVTITVDNKSKIFGVDDPELTGTVTGVFGDDNLNVTYARKAGDEKKNNVGDDITLTASYTANDNYNVTVKEGKLTISKAGSNTLALTGYNDVYDGQPHSVAVTTKPVAGTVLYSDDKVEWSETAPSFTNVGTYPVYAKVEHSNYETVEAEATVTITKRGVTLTSGSASKVYDGTALTNHTATVTDGSFVAGEGATYTFTGSQTAVGSSKNTFGYNLNEGTKAGNYNITTVEGTLTVSAATVPPVTPDPTPDPEPERPVRPVRPNPNPRPNPGPNTDTTEEIEIIDEETPLAGLDGLNMVDHFAYIMGYDSGLVRPEANITRAEVATIFFRLMTDLYRQINWATENPFSDVEAKDWFNNAVSTSASAGIVDGYPDSSFAPNKFITRAEFAKIAACFLSEEYVGPTFFTDTEGHWAEEYINRAAQAGWITGDGDGSFRPNDYIKRAEAMKLVNAMLGRKPTEEGLLDGMKVWEDNMDTSKWYYLDVQEATNSHDYERVANEENDLLSTAITVGDEFWTALLPEQDWTALEKEWAEAYDAPAGEVMD